MKKILILGTFILWYGGIFAQDKKVAVFDPAGNVNADVKEIIREEISNVIVNARGYAVLERQLINKVLEENKFQMGGMVDNAQIGEIGKKMGANAVFVTSVTPTGNNLYISFKLIDVQTARIEMQKTGKTTRGESDIDIVVQRVVGEMLGTSGAASAKAASPAPAPAATTTPRKPPVGGLLADGMDVFSKGRELSRSEVRSLMANTDALRLYNKGVSRRRTGTALVWSGAIIAAFGVVGASVGYSGYDSGYGYYEDPDIMYTLSVPCITIGSALILGGITFRILGKYPVRKAVESYNSQLHSSSGGYTPELHFGFTQHGVGLTYKF